MGNVNTGNAFAIPDLWPPSTFASFEGDIPDPKILDLESLQIHSDKNTTLHIPDHTELNLPALSNFEHEPLEDFGTVNTSSLSASFESLSIAEGLEESVWSFPAPGETEPAQDLPEQSARAYIAASISVIEQPLPADASVVSDESLEIVSSSRKNPNDLQPFSGGKNGRK